MNRSKKNVGEDFLRQFGKALVGDSSGRVFAAPKIIVAGGRKIETAMNLTGGRIVTEIMFNALALDFKSYGQAKHDVIEYRRESKNHESTSVCLRSNLGLIIRH